MNVRRDPFWLGRMAFLAHSDRATCPYPSTYIEAQRWRDGWDHACINLSAINT